MKEEKLLTCIVCPIGCALSVMMDNAGILSVDGNTCKRGEAYARAELTNPTRLLTTTVVIEHGCLNRLPVFTEYEIPKSMLFEAMKVLNNVRVQAPVTLRQVIIEDLLGTGVKVLASRSMSVRSE